MDKLTATNISIYLNEHNNQIESEKSSSKIFKINYDDQEQRLLNNIKIKKDIEDDYKYCGKYTNKLPDINEFLKKVTNNTNKEIVNITKIINKLVSKVVKGYNEKYVWISLRVSYYNKFFDTTRWHTDGNYYPTDNELSKFVTALFGAGTLLKQSTDDSKKIFHETDKELWKLAKGKSNDEKSKIINEYRPIFDEKLKDIPTIQLKNDEGIIFYAGGKYYSQIHSEPKMDKPRMFLSIFPMNKEGYEHMKDRSQCKKMEGGSINYHNKLMKYQQKYNMVTN